jgi:predicted O-methyltransferase YrrM
MLMAIKTISQEQLNNGRLFKNKEEYAKHIPKGSRILEIGTLAGDYAEVLINEVKPASIDLIDVFEAHDWPDCNRFSKAGHFDFVKNRFKNVKAITYHKGYSEQIMPTLDKTFDYIYIDANHDYEHCKTDLINALPLLAEDGIIGFNDYIVDKDHGVDYGVIEVVCEFLDQNKDWEVVGFALQENMYADIYIKRI